MRRDDVCGADIDAWSQKHVELSAVIQGKCVKNQILVGDFCVYQATDVLPYHGGVREHRAFRLGFRAAGIDDLRQVMSLEFEDRRR